MTQLGERDAVDVDAHASEMFAEKPTDARADAEPRTGVVREAEHPRTNDRARHTPDAPATAHVHAGAPTVAAAATPLIAIVAARTTTGTPPRADDSRRRRAAASKNPYVAGAAERRPVRRGKTHVLPEPPKYHPTQHPACEYHQRGARGDRARAVLDASRRRGSSPTPGNHQSDPPFGAGSKTRGRKESNIARPHRCSNVATRESPNNAGRSRRRTRKGGRTRTPRRASRLRDATRRREMPGAASRHVGSGSLAPFTVSPGSDPRCDLNEEGVGKEKAR